MRVNQTNRSALLFYVVVIDALFLPYIRFMHISLSMIILFFWYILKFFTIKKDKGFYAVICFACIAFASIIVGTFSHPEYAISNTTNLFMLLWNMLYYYFYKSQIEKKRYDLINVFFVFLVLAAVMAVFYKINPQGYFTLRSYWSMSGVKIEFKNAFYNRFTFIESDPNSIGPILCSMMLYMLFADDLAEWKKIIAIALTGFTVLVTISATAVLVYCGSIFLYLITKKWHGFSLRISVNGIFMMFAVIIGVAFFLYIGNHGLFQVNTVQYLRTRVGANIMDGTMSGRTDIWKNIIESFNWINYVILGRGVLLDRYGTVRKPHNGHFYMILSYGFIGYFLFIYIFFRKARNKTWKEFIPLIPMFLLFSVNTLVLDYRAMLALSIVAAVCHAKVKIVDQSVGEKQNL